MHGKEEMRGTPCLLDTSHQADRVTALGYWQMSTLYCLLTIGTHLSCQLWMVFEEGIYRAATRIRLPEKHSLACIGWIPLAPFNKNKENILLQYLRPWSIFLKWPKFNQNCTNPFDSYETSNEPSNTVKTQWFCY